jgi:hypothetical protein
VRIATRAGAEQGRFGHARERILRLARSTGSRGGAHVLAPLRSRRAAPAPSQSGRTGLPGPRP